MVEQLKKMFLRMKRLAKKRPDILRYEALEQRLLFSADIAPGLDANPTDDQVVVQDINESNQEERKEAEESEATPSVKCRNPSGARVRQ